MYFPSSACLTADCLTAACLTADCLTAACLTADTTVLPCIGRVALSVDVQVVRVFVLFSSYSAWTGELCLSLFWLRIQSLQSHSLHSVSTVLCVPGCSTQRSVAELSGSTCPQLPVYPPPSLPATRTYHLSTHQSVHP